jgi:hypothetical protein
MKRLVEHTAQATRPGFSATGLGVYARDLRFREGSATA